MYYGIRTQDVPFEQEGEIMNHVSVDWIDGTMTDNELPGVCALWYDEDIHDLQEIIDKSRKIYGYGTDCHTALISSYSMAWGNDDGEIILENPRVIKIYK